MHNFNLGKYFFPSGHGLHALGPDLVWSTILLKEEGRRRRRGGEQGCNLSALIDLLILISVLFVFAVLRTVFEEGATTSISCC